MKHKINKLIITGGGTGGHAFPAIRIAQAFLKRKVQVFYIGSRNGMEKKLAEDFGIRYEGVFTGKLRRYFSWQNFIDPLLIILGFFESLILILKFKPDVIFSKGGYVSFPVVLAGFILRIPIVLHESDLIPGLANRLLVPLANKICLSFQESLKYIDSKKAIFTGNPIREELLLGDEKKARILASFDEEVVPVVLVLGGSLGAEKLNNLVKQSLIKLLESCCVVLQCGRGKQIEIENQENKNRFFQVEFLGLKALANFYKLATVVVSRAGAGQITELMALGKPSIFVPLSSQVSRGDQIKNAELLKEHEAAVVLDEDRLTVKDFTQEIITLLSQQKLQKKLSIQISKFYSKDCVKKIINIIENVVEIRNKKE